MDLRALILEFDERLQQHEQYGDSRAIVGRVVERYRFALDLLARRDERLRELARRIEELDAGSAGVLLGDVLVRAQLEAAIGRLETIADEDEVQPEPDEPLRSILVEALSSLRGDPTRSLAGRAMERDLAVGPSKRTWVWDVPERSTPIADRLRESIRDGFMPGAKSSVEIIRPTTSMVESLERACSLLGRLVPHIATSVFQHLHSIAIARIEGPRGRMLTGSGGDGTPCMIFIDPDELENPWDTAGHILHEGIHLKLSDLIRTGAIVTDDEPVLLPWGRKTALSNCVFAYHAYAHMQVFRAAVQHLGPALHAELGAPGSYRAAAHAMSVVNESADAPFSRAQERLEYLHDALAGELAPRVTRYGSELNAWLWDTIRPLLDATEAGPPRPERPGPAAADRFPSSVRYRQRQDVAVRRSPSAEVMFALDPASRAIVTLNLSAWLAFELCEGQTEDEMLSAYAASLRLPAERAWLELAPTLEELRARGLIEPVAERVEAPP